MDGLHLILTLPKAKQGFQRRGDEEMKYEVKHIKPSKENEKNLIKVSARELIGKFLSKSDIYDYLKFKHGLFLPSYSEAKLSKFISY